MDISGPVRRILRERGGSSAAPGEPLGLMAWVAGHAEVELADLPPFLGDGAALLVGAGGGGGGGRAAYGWLGLSGMLRILPRVSRGKRGAWEAALARQMEPVVEGAKMMLVMRSASVAGVLWHYYLLLLGRKRIRMNVPDVLLQGLWKKGMAGGAAGAGGGPLQGANSGAAIEAFTYEELCGIHAAFNAVALEGGGDGLDTVERVVRWHVENTQPDHGTQEPWGLAAFAALDETGTFAPQQIHDATNRMERGGDGRVILALLADAVMTQEG